jgi:hypothetical protein
MDNPRDRAHDGARVVDLDAHRRRKFKDEFQRTGHSTQWLAHNGYLPETDAWGGLMRDPNHPDNAPQESREPTEAEKDSEFSEKYDVDL